MKQLVQNIWLRSGIDNNETKQVLILITLFSLGMQTIRIAYTGNILFSFLVWNLILAFAPYVISTRISSRAGIISRTKLLSSTIIWLLLIPNSFYILTDLFHLDMNEDVPQWFDLALLLGFAWNGLLFGMVSVRQMEKVFENYFNHKPGMLFILPVMFLNGLGIYIGRYLRFNSWDVITNPLQLSSDIIYLFIHPLRNRFDWSMIICYTALMTIIYVTVKKLAKTL